MGAVSGPPARAARWGPPSSQPGSSQSERREGDSQVGAVCLYDRVSEAAWLPFCPTAWAALVSSAPPRLGGRVGVTVLRRASGLG